jgi:peptidoglycan/xylan/chitin deacetylase (PgdA/CDA1 family)
MSLKGFIIETMVGNFPAPPSKVIFIYHDISEADSLHHSPYYSTTPANFRKQIDFIRKKFTIVPLDDLLLNEQKEDRNYAALTFDDGFESVLSVALPILQSAAIPFTTFLNQSAIVYNQLWVSNLFIKENDPDFLNNFFNAHNFERSEKKEFLDNPVDYVRNNFEKTNLPELISRNTKFPKVYLNERDVKQLDSLGVRIGNHTDNHPVLAALRPETQQNEIQGNKLYLESLVRQKIDLLAIPFGKKSDYNSLTDKISKATGHTHLFSSNPTFVNHQTQVPRIGLTNESIRTIKFYLKRPLLKKIDI